MSFKKYRSNSTPIRHHGRSNQGESRNQTREMRANTNVDPAIPRSATMGNVDLYTSIKGQGHQELFPDPANHQPSLAHLSTLSQHLSSTRNQTRDMRDIQIKRPTCCRFTGDDGYKNTPTCCRYTVATTS